MKRYFSVLCLLLLTSFMTIAQAQPTTPKPVAPKYNLSTDPVLYTVGYSHLDTEWRWDYQETINDFLKNTLDENFRLIEKYKPYTFTFSGARRYKMMQEYYPERYEKLKKYISLGRWCVGGSSVDECDVNIPSPESVIRQVLYGNGFFKSEFNRESVDFMLPDCFGFQADLPSVLAHAGLKGFSTQKLSWGSAMGIPFNLGTWLGPDGKGIVSALNATDYNGRVTPRIDTTAYWINRIMDNGKKFGVFADYRYYGVGDTGGSPREEDIKNAIGSIDQPDSKIKVYLTSSDQLFRDLKESEVSKLPTYSGDLLLTEHSSGSLTSQAYMKRWNRKNEQLALAAEPVAVIADWLGGIKYPLKSMNATWWLVLGSQMHDILPGTSIPKAYTYAWNDEALAMNQFSSILQSSVGAVIRAMDTRGKGKSMVVYNPLAISRKDIVEAEISYPDGAPQSVVIVNAENDTIPVQILKSTKTNIQIAFPASVPSFGFACYDIQPAKEIAKYQSGLSASAGMLDNEFLKVTVNAAGDISSIIDKKLGKELLSSPSRLEFQKEHPAYWPAWNMDWNDRQNPPIDFVGGPATITLVEKGPVRATLCVERTARNSVFTQYITLVSGQEQLFVRNIVRWQSRGVSLKASFPLTASNEKATYNLGLGTIERVTNHKKQYEVPSREWFDLTDKSGRFGITILEDSKFGSDKPNDNTLRLTLLFTPTANTFNDQATQDWGIHEFTYGIYSHKGDWRTALSEWQGRRLNQPLVAFITPQHGGFLGKNFSFAQVSASQVDIRTIKKAENGKDIVIRLQELTGKDISNVEVTFASKIIRAWEVDGQERVIGEASLKNGKLIVAMTGFAIRSFAIQVEPPADRLSTASSFELPLVFDQDVVSNDNNMKNGGFDSKHKCFPAEQFPTTVTLNGIQFNLGATSDGKNNVVTCKGQKIFLPKTGNFSHAYILAAALTDTAGIFKVGGAKTLLHIQQYEGKIGQFDNRTWDRFGRVAGLEKGFIKRDEVAWYCTHLHQDTVNIPYNYGYIYVYRLDASPASETLQLPENESIKIFAITVSDNSFDQIQPAQALYDDFSARQTMTLNLPKSWVTEQMQPLAQVDVTKKRNMADLPGRLTMKDYADIHQPNGVSAQYFYSGADTDQSGLPQTSGAMNVSAINDGMFDLLPVDSANDRWSATGEGRIRMDLQHEIEIDSLHIFTVQQLNRGQQAFSIWGAKGEMNPEVKGNPAAAGWKFIAFVQPEDIWGNDKALYKVVTEKNQKLQFRYLMFISEDSPHGPYYFREVDVFEKQN
ncbi:MAG: glycoside hydrolase family 38 C-terminal domain-containing protein [Bacteroidota bacterium]